MDFFSCCTRQMLRRTPRPLYCHGHSQKYLINTVVLFYFIYPLFINETHGDHCTVYKWSKIREKNYTKSNNNDKECVGLQGREKLRIVIIMLIPINIITNLLECVHDFFCTSTLFRLLIKNKKNYILCASDFLFLPWYRKRYRVSFSLVLNSGIVTTLVSCGHLI